MKQFDAQQAVLAVTTTTEHLTAGRVYIYEGGHDGHSQHINGMYPYNFIAFGPIYNEALEVDAAWEQARRDNVGKRVWCAASDIYGTLLEYTGRGTFTVQWDDDRTSYRVHRSSLRLAPDSVPRAEPYVLDFERPSWLDQTQSFATGTDHGSTGRCLTTDSSARKDVPMFTGLLAYFPDALAEVARLSKVGNDKHNPGQPLHWSRHLSNDHGDCLVRHQVDAGIVDTDGFLHDVKVAWRALAQLQVALENQA